jgi:hypothetical protein
MPTSTPASFENACALILSNYALNLQQQIIFCRAANRPVEKHHLDTGSAELVNKQHLVSISTRKPIRRVDVDTVDLTASRGIAQTFQRWTRQRGSAVTLVNVGAIWANHCLFGGGTFSQSRNLARDGILACLAVA